MKSLTIFMKKHGYFRVLAAFLGLLWPIMAKAQPAYFITTNIFQGFDTGTNKSLFSGSGNGSVGGWILWYGQGGEGFVDGSDQGFDDVPVECDPSQNSPVSEDTNASGALLIDIQSWNNGTGDGGPTGVMFGTFNDDQAFETTTGAWAINANLYESISFDIMVSNTIPMSAAGDFGHIGVGFIDYGEADGAQTYGDPTIPGSAQGHWTHIVVPLTNSTIADAGDIVGWCFEYGQSEAPAYPAVGQQVVFWLDNVRVNLKPPSPPPTLTDITPATPGMNLWMIGFDTNQEEDLESDIEGGNGWQLATGANPVEYALTLAPNPVPPAGFRTFVVINTDDLPATQYVPDAAAISMAELDIVSAGDGTATGYFRYRINDTSDYLASTQNTNVFGPNTGTNGTLASVSGPLGGTWTLKFTSPSSGSIIAPSGASSSVFTLNGNAVLAFSETSNPKDDNSQELSLYVGAGPNGSAGLGKEVVLTDFAMTNNAGAFEDNFATDIGPAPSASWLGVVSEFAGTTIQIPVSANGPDVWVQNTLPADGYDLLGSTTIPGDWTLLTGTNSVDTDTATSLGLGSTQVTAIPLADVENISTGVPTNQLYFEMIKNDGGLHQ